MSTPTKTWTIAKEWQLCVQYLLHKWFAPTSRSTLWMNRNIWRLYDLNIYANINVIKMFAQYEMERIIQGYDVRTITTDELSLIRLMLTNIDENRGFWIKHLISTRLQSVD